jgi:hypothetical protein
MSWEWILPAALFVGFVLLWLFVLPRLGLKT